MTSSDMPTATVMIRTDEEAAVLCAKALGEIETVGSVKALLAGTKVKLPEEAHGQVVTFSPSQVDGELEWHTDHIHLQVPASGGVERVDGFGVRRGQVVEQHAEIFVLRRRDVGFGGAKVAAARARDRYLWLNVGDGREISIVVQHRMVIWKLDASGYGRMNGPKGGALELHAFPALDEVEANEAAHEVVVPKGAP